MVSSKHAKLAALTLTFAGLAGCTDQQVAVALGAVGIGAGAAAIGAAAASSGPGVVVVTPPPPPPRGHMVCVPTPVRQDCHTWYNYYGVPQTRCSTITDPCGRRDWVSYLQDFQEDESGGDVDPLHADVSSSDWARTFNMSDESADTLVSALKQARDGDASALGNLGLSQSDLRSMAKLKMPSSNGIDRMAKTLDQSPASTKAMVKTLIEKGAQLKSETCANGNAQDATYAALCEK